MAGWGGGTGAGGSQIGDDRGQGSGGLGNGGNGRDRDRDNQNPSNGSSAADTGRYGPTPTGGNIASWGAGLGDAVSRGLDAIGLGPRADMRAGAIYGGGRRLGVNPRVGNPQAALASFGEFAFSTALTAANPVAGLAYQGAKGLVRAGRRIGQGRLSPEKEDIVASLPGVGLLASDVLASERAAIADAEVRAERRAGTIAVGSRLAATRTQFDNLPPTRQPVDAVAAATRERTESQQRGAYFAQQRAFSAVATPAQIQAGASATTAAGRFSRQQAALDVRSSPVSLDYEPIVFQQDLAPSAVAAPAPAPAAAVATPTQRGFNPIDFARDAKPRSPSAVAAGKLTPISELTGIAPAYREHIAPVIAPAVAAIDTATTKAGKQIGEALVARGIDYNTALAPGTQLRQNIQLASGTAIFAGSLLGGVGAVRGGGVVGGVRQVAEARRTAALQRDIEQTIASPGAQQALRDIGIPESAIPSPSLVRGAVERQTATAQQNLAGAVTAAAAPSADASISPQRTRGRLGTRQTRQDNRAPVAAPTRSQPRGNNQRVGGFATATAPAVASPIRAPAPTPAPVSAPVASAPQQRAPTSPTPAVSQTQPQSTQNPAVPQSVSVAVPAAAPAGAFGAGGVSAPVAKASPAPAATTTRALAPAPSATRGRGGIGGTFPTSRGRVGVGLATPQQSARRNQTTEEDELLIAPGVFATRYESGGDGGNDGARKNIIRKPAATAVRTTNAGAAVTGGKYIRPTTLAPSIIRRGAYGERFATLPRRT